MKLVVALGLLVLALPAEGASQNPTQAHFDPARIVAYSDSFTMIIQGAESGWHRFTMERTGSGFLYRESFAIPGMMDRTLEVGFTSDLQVKTATASGRQFGQTIGADVRYSGQHATGWAISQGQAGPKRSTIDTTLPSGAFDGSALMAVLPALDWQLGAVYSVTMFDTDELNITTQTLRIAAEERLVVPAGTFDVYRADLSTTQAPVRLWYTRSAPHRLVKVGGATEDFVTVLASPRSR